MADEVMRERRGAVEILTINRPEARNAINGAVSTGLGTALDQLATDDAVAVVVLTGAGDKAFSAGMDLKAFAAGEAASIVNAPGGFGGIARRWFPKPLIAAVNGAALAGGFEIMLACDMVVAAEHARFGIPEVSRGLIAGAGALVRLPKRIPPAVALEMALTGEPVDAARAAALGLVNRVVPAGRLMEEALALADRIAQNAPLAVTSSKDLLRKAADLPEADAWLLNDEVFPRISASADAMEGSVAFAEKRAPRWQGR